MELSAVNSVDGDFDSWATNIPGVLRETLSSLVPEITRNHHTKTQLISQHNMHIISEVFKVNNVQKTVQNTFSLPLQVINKINRRETTNCKT